MDSDRLWRIWMVRAAMMLSPDMGVATTAVGRSVTVAGELVPLEGTTMTSTTVRSGCPSSPLSIRNTAAEAAGAAASRKRGQGESPWRLTDGGDEEGRDSEHYECDIEESRYEEGMREEELNKER